MPVPPRARAQAIATRRPAKHTLAVPLALRLAARIQERPLEDFFTDPTQLANGLREFFEAVGPDGIVVTDPEVLADEIVSCSVDELPTATRVSTAVEATGRLRSTFGDSAVLVAVLPGPASVAELRGDKASAGDIMQTLVKDFLGAGVDIIVFTETENASLADYEPVLRTSANMARFHRALTCLRGSAVSFLYAPTVVPLDEPRQETGLVFTETDLPTDTSVTLVQDWVAAVRGG